MRMSAGEQPKEKGAKASVKEFVYPGAKQLGKEHTGPGMYLGKFTTPDDFGKVSAWYKKVIGFEEEKGVTILEGIEYKQPGVWTSLADNSRQPGKDERTPGEPRPLTVQVLLKKTNDMLVVAVVSRGQDEKLTHVALTYMEHKAK
jgi:hypothetical protein